MKSPPSLGAKFAKAGLVVLLCLISPTLASPKKTANYSRSVVLPLVSSPGKSKALFASFPGRSQNAVWNKNFWGASLGFEQFTGMGWETPQPGILVSPEHVVIAHHYGVHRNGFHFYGADGRFLGNRQPVRDENNKLVFVTISPDIRVVRLASPAPDGAHIYPLPDPKTYQQRQEWAGLPKNERPVLIATDWRNPIPKKTNDPEERQRWRITRTAHAVLFQALNEQARSISWIHGKAGEKSVHPSYHEVINKGDSSHPIFWVTPAGFALAGHFSGVGGGPDYGHPEIQKELQAAIDKLGGKKPYKLKTIPVP